MPHRLRGELLGMELSRREHELLYERALAGSLKEAAAVIGVETGRNQMQSIFGKLGVTDEAGAYRAMGWLRPIPYRVSVAEVSHDRLLEGEPVPLEAGAMSYSITGRSKAVGVDPEKVIAAFTRLVKELDEAALEAGVDPTLFEGKVAGGDWQGDDRKEAHSFAVTAAEIRAQAGGDEA